jgi:hypothetical protein
VCQILHQIGHVGRGERVPHVTDGLALQATRVRQQPPEGHRAVCGHIEVLDNRIVEVYQSLVAALHHEHGGERLGDRPDPEALARLAHPQRPQRTVGAPQRDAQRGHPRVGLHLPHQPR